MADEGNVKAEKICYHYLMNEKRIAKLSDIAGNLGLIFFVSNFLDPVLKGNVEINGMVAGLLFTLSAWFVSLVLLK